MKSVDALEMYRQQFHTINYKDVTQFLLFSKAFPRSILFCLDMAEQALVGLPGSGESPAKAIADMADLTGMIQSSDAAHIIASGLHEFIDDFQARLNLVDESIYESYFRV